MRTEIDNIKEAFNIYEGIIESTHREYLAAESYLIKVWDTFGTINPAEIQNLLR